MVPTDKELNVMFSDMKLFISTIKDYLEVQLRQG